MDPKVNGQMQKDWGWLVAAYLFLGGVGSGAYVTAAVSSYAVGGASTSTVVGLWISWIALAIGTVCLLADLGQPLKAVLAGMKVGTSWIARGFWIISGFMIVAFLHTVLVVFAGTHSGPLVSFLTVAGVCLALGTMAYTGLLLGAAKGIPFWRSGVVPVIFAVSALATGHFTVMLGMGFSASGIGAAELKVMSAEAAILVALEVVAILFFLQAAYRIPDAKESAQRILRRTSFVLGYCVLGLAAPLLIMAIIYLGAEAADGLSGVALVGAALGLVGGLILRHSVLVTGALPTWNMAGFKFRRIARPKQPRPAIGMMPPS